MTDEQFEKMKFQKGMILDYINPRLENKEGGFGVRVPCLLVYVDFDNMLFKLWPVDPDYHQDEVIVNHSYVERHFKKLEAIKK